MTFSFIDAIEEVEAGKRLVAIKCVSLGEDYLRDHFPMLPVLPGVLMLEGMFQAASWLVRVTEDFQHSTVRLEEASQVKYSGLVQPGQTLRLVAELVRQSEGEFEFKAHGVLVADGTTVVTGKLRLRSLDLGSERPGWEPLDRELRSRFRSEWETLCRSRHALALVKS